nr:hypothetical protein BgiMline_030142 [Biomphalaria glabrata]
MTSDTLSTSTFSLWLGAIQPHKTTDHKALSLLENRSEILVSDRISYLKISQYLFVFYLPITFSIEIANNQLLQESSQAGNLERREWSEGGEKGRDQFSAT